MSASGSLSSLTETGRSSVCPTRGPRPDRQGRRSRDRHQSGAGCAWSSTSGRPARRPGTLVPGVPGNTEPGWTQPLRFSGAGRSEGVLPMERLTWRDGVATVLVVLLLSTFGAFLVAGPNI